ncbi:hypothetical protein RUM44_012477 [Polyplax serrata]|uniref:Serpin domain-containing protein n=1 Tax=Polyplax serrata TaxID=468196 RepID=A0ABR1BDI2_POLSC
MVEAKVSLVPLLSVGLLLLLGWAGADETESNNDFAINSANFCIEMLKSQAKLNEGNVVMSPFSVGTMLAILQVGARENTLKQLDEALRMPVEVSSKGHSLEIRSLMGEKKDVTLEWGNRLYIRPGFEVTENFNKTITEVFGSSFEELNFVEPSPQEAAEKINSWVKEVTHNNIKDLVTPSLLNSDTVLVLLNAIYFKGLWDVPFKKSLTQPDKFELTAENSAEVPFMAQKERFLAGEDPESGIMWVDLPFKDAKYSMLFMLPTERHGLNKALEGMTGNLLQNIIKDEQTRQVTMRIPKFKLTQKSLLAGALKELNVTDIFSAAANLSGISTQYNNLRVTKMIHQASVEIDEDGSTASAATGVFVEVLSFPKSSDHLEFKADHPFLFFILDRANGIPLFAGKVADPS